LPARGGQEYLVFGDLRLGGVEKNMSESIENQFEFRRIKSQDEEILKDFSVEEQREIKKKQEILSSLAFFVGKDFQIPVELNKPGGGWHWDFENNIIRIDPKDLLERPMDYLRFVISHEGGHRRISRVGFIPLEIWQQPGFSFMMNAIEDPRDNNFVAENYPKFREQMELAYKMNLDLEQKTKIKAKEKLGYQPRFMQAGFEYIKQWFKETLKEKNEISENLPGEVRMVVEKTLKSAEDSWKTFPTRKMADGQEMDEAGLTGEDSIVKHAKVSYEINLEEIWPEFKKLVEQDMQDQKMQEFMKEIQQKKGEGKKKDNRGQEIPQEIKGKLSPKEQKELEKAIKKAIKEAEKRKKQQKKDKGESEEQKDDSETNGEGVSIDLDSLSKELQEKIKKYIESLPEDKKKELAEKAEKSIRGVEKELDKEIEGKLIENPDKKSKKEEKELKKQEGEKNEEENNKKDKDKTSGEEIEKFRDFIEKTINKDANMYEQERREVLDIINSLENDLRAIFRERRQRRWETGKKSGPSIDIERRIKEIAQDTPAIESLAWQKREKPTEKDYAITILIDLSGSMSGSKIQETFKAVIVLTEVLNRLSIKTEILGFNDRIYEYQKFKGKMSNDIRERMGNMLKEVDDRSDTGKANYNDDGWALTKASERLAAQREKEKFLIVLSDGIPEESPMHPRSDYELSKIIQKIISKTDQKLIGLGIGSGTSHVKKYYPNSVANVGVKEMSEKLAELIKEVIANYNKF